MMSKFEYLSFEVGVVENDRSMRELRNGMKFYKGDYLIMTPSTLVPWEKLIIK